MSMWALVILILTSFRMTRLVVDDTITEPIRMKFVDWHDRTHSKVSHFFLNLITCQWCIGYWLSGIAVLIYLQGVSQVWPGFVYFLFLWNAVAGGAALVGTLVYKMED